MLVLEAQWKGICDLKNRIWELKDIFFTQGFQSEFLSGLGNWYAFGKPSYEREFRNKWNIQT